MIISVLALLACGCTSVQPNNVVDDKSEGPLIARALFTKQECESDPNKGKAESTVAVAATTWIIEKAADKAVNFFADAVRSAAEQDKNTFTISGQSADFIFNVQGEEITMNKCLYVIVAPRIQNSTWCEPNAEGNWHKSTTCMGPQELKDAWLKWDLGKPVFFAEIVMDSSRGGPVGVVIPNAYRIYYPAPISKIPIEKVKGLSISVTATKPTKSSKETGDIILEVFLGGDGVTPKAELNKSKLQTSGLWVVLPGMEGIIGKKFAGPVNLSVTLAETQNPTKWLQTVAKFVDENKQKAIEEIVKNTDPVKKAAAAQAEIVSKLSLEEAAATQCSSFSEQMDKLASAKKDVADNKGETEEEKLRFKYALDAACATTNLSARTTLAAWIAAGNEVSTSKAFCKRKEGHDDEIKKICKYQ